jgi:hypothetical protein
MKNQICVAAAKQDSSKLRAGLILNFKNARLEFERVVL